MHHIQKLENIQTIYPKLIVTYWFRWKYDRARPKFINASKHHERNNSNQCKNPQNAGHDEHVLARQLAVQNCRAS